MRYLLSEKCSNSAHHQNQLLELCPCEESRVGGSLVTSSVDASDEASEANGTAGGGRSKANNDAKIATNNRKINDAIVEILLCRYNTNKNTCLFLPLPSPYIPKLNCSPGDGFPIPLLRPFFIGLCACSDPTADFR